MLGQNIIYNLIASLYCFYGKQTFITCLRSYCTSLCLLKFSATFSIT